MWNIHKISSSIRIVLDRELQTYSYKIYRNILCWFFHYGHTLGYKKKKLALWYYPYIMHCSLVHNKRLLCRIIDCSQYQRSIDRFVQTLFILLFYLVYILELSSIHCHIKVSRHLIVLRSKISQAIFQFYHTHRAVNFLDFLTLTNWHISRFLWLINSVWGRATSRTSRSGLYPISQQCEDSQFTWNLPCLQPLIALICV